MPRRIFGLQEGKAKGCWRRLNNEVLHKEYALPYAIRLVKSRNEGWVRNIACMGEMRSVYNTLVGESERRELVSNRCGREDLRMERISQKLVGNMWTRFIWLRTQSGPL